MQLDELKNRVESKGLIKAVELLKIVVDLNREDYERLDALNILIKNNHTLSIDAEMYMVEFNKIVSKREEEIDILLSKLKYKDSILNNLYNELEKSKKIIYSQSMQTNELKERIDKLITECEEDFKNTKIFTTLFVLSFIANVVLMLNLS